MTIQAKVNEITFTDADIVDVENCCYEGDYNPHSNHPFLFHDHGFVLCVVFAEHLQDALDEAVDADKLDRYQISDNTLNNTDQYKDGEGITYAGNASEPFDFESLGIIELRNPRRSWVAEYNATFGEVKADPVHDIDNLYQQK